MSTTVTVSLCRFGPPRPVDDRHRGRVVCLPERGMVVIAETRSAGGGWRCAVIARRVPAPGPGHVTLSTADMDAAETTIAVDSEKDPDGFVMAWQVRVWCLGLGGRKALVARALAESPRPAGTVRVVLTAEAYGKVMNAANLRTYALRSILARLVAQGFLDPVPGQDASQALAPGTVGRPDTYVLTIPAGGHHG
jgi:hypothetical protein